MDLKQLRIHRPDKINEISAKAFYSQISLGKKRGAYLRDVVRLACRWGAVSEKIVKSYKDDGTTDEDFMFDKSWKNPQIDKLAEIMKGKNHRVITARNDMDLFARAILENHGVVGGVNGQNGKGWATEFPQRPDPNNRMWGHAIALLAFGKDEKGKFIATPNSWDLPFQQGKKWDKTKPIGYGWQKLYIDYFKGTEEERLGEKYTFYPVFNPWTYTDLKNNHKLMENLIENTFYQVVTGKGGFGLFADGKMFVDDTAKLQASWIIRNGGDIKGKTGTLTEEQFNAVDHFNLKREKIN